LSARVMAPAPKPAR